MIHPTIAAAAEGTLPAWARASEQRRAHMARVAELMGRWAGDLRLGPDESARWRAAGWLHDAVRGADPDSLRSLVDPPLAELPPKMLHGPAAAALLRRDGVDDEPLLRAIAFHTVGHPDLDRLGRALYLADYLEPGREYTPGHLAALRARLPREIDEVTRVVAAERIGGLLEDRHPLRPETCAFWNALTHG